MTVFLGGNPGGATLGGTVTVPANQGVATFSGLSLNSSGNGYSIMVSIAGLTVTVSTTPFKVTPPPPVIISEQIVFHRKTNKKGKPIGKAILAGFQLDFSTAMNPASTGNPESYRLNTITTKKVKRKIVDVLKPMPFQVIYNPGNDSVDLMLIGKQTFPTGGEIMVLASPTGGVSSAAGVFLDGSHEGIAGDNGVFFISKNAKSIT